MPLAAPLEERLQKLREKRSATAAAVKRGPDIFKGTDYPQDWSGFIGQTQAREQLIAQVASARARNVRLDHTLLASGLHGIGKTTIAMLMAGQAGRGLVQVSGALSVSDARDVLLGMTDGDILFWDEIHLAVAGNRNRADWMLPFLTDGTLVTNSGVEQMPDVTVVGATTDVGKLPQTLISRFMVRPTLVGYTPEEGELLVANLSGRMQVPVLARERAAIARAANNNPRDMRMILTAVRDLNYITSGAEPIDLDKAFEWAGVSYDGLSTVAQEMLLTLLVAPDHTASIDSIQAQLSEPGPLRHHEQVLLQRGYVTITGRGRCLTDEGVARAIQLNLERTA